MWHIRRMTLSLLLPIPKDLFPQQWARLIQQRFKNISVRTLIGSCFFSHPLSNTLGTRFLMVHVFFWNRCSTISPMHSGVAPKKRNELFNAIFIQCFDKVIDLDARDSGGWLDKGLALFCTMNSSIWRIPKSVLKDKKIFLGNFRSIWLNEVHRDRQPRMIHTTRLFLCLRTHRSMSGASTTHFFNVTSPETKMRAFPFSLLFNLECMDEIVEESISK